MKVKIILNPYANRWRARAQIAAIEAALAGAHLAYDLAVSQAAGQGVSLAQAAAQAGYDAVVAAGGDGTLNEVANGLITAAGSGCTVPLGVLPIGTANDFSDMAGLPRELGAAVQVIAAGKTRQIDAGQVKVDGDVHYFINNSAVAMEPMVTLENIKMTRLSGIVRYMVALLRALIKLKAWQMRIAWDGGNYNGPTYLLSVCNGPRTGGFYMAPEAQMDDGLLDFVFAPEVSKGTVIAVLLRLFQKTHIHHPRVIYSRTSSMTIDSQPGTPVHADGELLSEAATAIAYSILPGKITLLTP
jgi:diacylglycerol kinase (ATP)